MTGLTSRARPAETAGGLTAAATAIAALLGAGVEVVAVVGTLAGLLPTLVTALVAHGGVRGLLRTLWGGSRPPAFPDDGDASYDDPPAP